MGARSMAGPSGLSARAQFNIVLAAIALTALMVATMSLTADGPQLAEEGVGGSFLAADASVSERDVILEGVDTTPSSRKRHPKNYDKQQLVEPLEDNVLFEQDTAAQTVPEQGDLDSLSATLAATQATLKSEAAERGGSTTASSDSDTASTEGKVAADAAQTSKSADAASADAASADAGSSDTMDNPKVKAALQAAANAKIQALSAQQKALAAGTAAKEAAAQAAQAPLTQAGQEVVKRAQKKVQEAKLDVDTAKAAMVNLKNLKTKASKAIIDAAGGGGGAQQSYADQGGYFGAALRTAYNNGVLSEKLKQQEWKTTELEKAKTQSFDKGEAVGEKKGFEQGKKAGAKEELRRRWHKLRRSSKTRSRRTPQQQLQPRILQKLLR